jgi:hypothetical protein
MEAIAIAGFGVRAGAIEGEDHPLIRAYAGMIGRVFAPPPDIAILAQAIALKLPPWLLALTEYLPLEAMKTLRRAKESGLKFAKELIGEKRKDVEGLRGEDKDILTILVKAGEPGLNGKLTPMADEEIYAQLT